MSAEVSTVVIDNGSYTCKGGFSGETSPQADVSLASLAIEKSPIERGVIVNWEDIEKLWRHMITDELKVNAAEHPVFLTEPPLTSKEDRERMAQVMFETFNVPSFFVGTSAVLGLYSAGYKSGLSVEIGHGVSHVVPVRDGYAVAPAIQRLNVGGFDITNRLVEILGQRCDYATANRVKEEFGFVALDIEAVASTDCTISLTLPDGNMSISNERFTCAEVLAPIHDLIAKSISLCEEPIRPSLFSSIVASGGTSMLRGLPERITKEVSARAPESTRVKVITPHAPKYASWIGGSILASLEPFGAMMVTRQEYADSGPRIVGRKCP